MKTRPYRKTLLPNGVRLILVPMNGVNSIATTVMVGVGSRYETTKISGISHFLEHMVFKGTTKYPTTEDVNIIERAGGLQNAYTDIDVTNYHNKVLAEDWELGLEINKELALNPRLEERWVDKERDVIIEEMKRYEDEPAAKAEETIHHMLYGGTRLGMRTIGEEKSLRAVASRELRAYHSAWYKPEKMVIVVSGNLEGKQENLEHKVQKWFGDLKGKPEGDIERVKDIQKTPKLEVVTKRDAQQAHLIIGLRTFARGSEDRFAWNIFNILMGVGFTSRLFKEVREKRGLCYHVRSENSSFADCGYWEIYAGVATAKVEEATKAIITELSKAVAKGVTDDEIKVAKKRLKTVVAFRSEDPEFFTEWYGRQEVYNQPVMTLDDYIKKIDAVSKKDMNVLIKKYFKTETLNMALVWSKPRDEKLLHLLTI